MPPTKRHTRRNSAWSRPAHLYRSIAQVARDLSVSNQTLRHWIKQADVDAGKREVWPRSERSSSAVFDYIETFYNRERRHSTLGFLSPREFEMISLPRQAEEQKSSPDLSPEAGEDQFNRFEPMLAWLASNSDPV